MIKSDEVHIRVIDQRIGMGIGGLDTVIRIYHIPSGILIEEARHGNREALERLEVELREARMTELSALGQAQEAYEAQQRLEAKLAKAVDVDLIEQCIRDVLEEGGTVRDAAEYVASATLAELTGGKDE